jgi:hypothetical protein
VDDDVLRSLERASHTAQCGREVTSCGGLFGKDSHFSHDIDLSSQRLVRRHGRHFFEPSAGRNVGSAGVVSVELLVGPGARFRPPALHRCVGVDCFGGVDTENADPYRVAAGRQAYVDGIAVDDPIDDTTGRRDGVSGVCEVRGSGQGIASPPASRQRQERLHRRRICACLCAADVGNGQRTEGVRT